MVALSFIDDIALAAGFGGLYKKGLGAQVSITPPAVRASDWYGWVWPLPIWYAGQMPMITDHFYRFKSEAHRKHLGADIMLRKLPGDDWPFPYQSKPGAIGFIPGDELPVIATYRGTVRWAKQTSKGYAVILDHGKIGKVGIVRSFYQHMQDPVEDWQKGDEIETGQILGYVGGDVEKGAYRLYHLHFGLMFPKKEHNPSRYMKFWDRLHMGELNFT